MELIVYGGRVMAIVSATRVEFTPEVFERGARDPLVRFVAMMVFYAVKVRDGEGVPPYINDEAEYFARKLLMDDQRFLLLDFCGMPEADLAGYLQVPVEQVAKKREDLRLDGITLDPIPGLENGAGPGPAGDV